MIEACTRCAPEYGGFRCGGCAANHYKIDGQCMVCPDHQWVVLLIVAVVLVGLVALGFWIASRAPDGMSDALSTASISIVFLQMVRARE